jgi:histidinol phosphatase-like enzyme
MTGMIESALVKYPSIDLSKSMMIGDSESDQLLAFNTNIKFYKVDSNKPVGMNGVYQSIDEIAQIERKMNETS